MWRHLSLRTRVGVGAAAALAICGRIAALAAAYLYSAGDSRTAVIVAVAAAILFLLRRIAAASVRVDADCDLHVSASRALLAGDVLDEPQSEPHFALTSGIYYATDATANTLPSMIADLVATVPAMLLLGWLLPARVVLALGVAAAVVVISTMALRARIARLHERATDAQERLGDALAATLHGRLEIVAASEESAAVGRVVERAALYATAARRAAFGAAVLGRAPLGVAVVAGAVVVALAADRGELWAHAVTSGVLLAAALPPVLGLTFGWQEMARLHKRLAPFANLVIKPARPDVSRANAEVARALAPLVFERVAFAYDERGPLVIEDMSFDWSSGAVVLRGPNGAGKSTLLRLVLGLRAPSAGKIRLGDLDLASLDVRSLRRRSAYLPQRPYLGEPYATVADAFHLLVPSATREQMLGALESVGLVTMLGASGGDPLSRKVSELSVGQRQRLGLARALCRDAELVLLDEPDANLDHAGVERLTKIVAELTARGRLVAVCAHGPLAEMLDAKTLTVEAARPGPRDRST